MDVEFSTRKLEKCYRHCTQGVKMWGATVARKYIQRIDILQEASDLAEIETLPGLDCHPLKGKRRGQYAITLHDRWRLIFSMQGQQVKAVRIEEVTKHYGD